jgi:hypothetical protein
MWIASRLDDDEIPVRYQWIVESEDGSMTVGFAEEGGVYLGFTEADAESLAATLNGYIDREAIDQAEIKTPPRGEMN